MLLKNKVAIVSGASAGIGRATALLFANQGAKVIVGARREKELNTLVQEIDEIGGQAIAYLGDATTEHYAEGIVASAIENFGKLDIAFNNAGMLGDGLPIIEKSTESWHQEINSNLTSGFLAAKYQINAMKEKGGSIIFTSSFVGNTIGFPGKCAYAASKAGLVGLTKCLAVEWAGANIRVNALLPGGTDTAMAKEFGDSPEVREFVNSIHALKRIAQPEEIAQSALYLASEQSSFTTGSAMLVDGGVSINKT